MVHCSLSKTVLSWPPAPFIHMSAHRPLGSSFLGLPYRILNINHKKEPLRSLWVADTP